MKKRRSPVPAKKRAKASGPRFQDLLKEQQREIEARLQADDPDERHKALQRRLSGYDIDHLTQFFGVRAVTSIQGAAIRDYAIHRQTQGAAVETVNHELRTLLELSRFALRRGLAWTPTIELLRDLTPRPALRTERWWFRKLPPVANTPDTPPGSRLNETVFHAHLQRHPLDRQLSDARRAQFLQSEHGITVNRSTVARWRQRISESPPTQPL